MTPDGQWIWFNSDATGAMHLWRIRSDGQDRQRMTFDDRVNWFPHPSPCGRQVLYLSYPADTRGHPRDLDVELRLMPASGGEPRLLLALFGGQGSLNVPCWSPDSRHFAFVRYHPAK
jgi:Tol biopolymer transport system component